MRAAVILKIGCGEKGKRREFCVGLSALLVDEDGLAPAIWLGTARRGSSWLVWEPWRGGCRVSSSRRPCLSRRLSLGWPPQPRHAAPRCTARLPRPADDRGGEEEVGGAGWSRRGPCVVVATTVFPLDVPQLRVRAAVPRPARRGRAFILWFLRAETRWPRGGRVWMAPGRPSWPGRPTRPGVEQGRGRGGAAGPIRTVSSSWPAGHSGIRFGCHCVPSPSEEFTHTAEKQNRQVGGALRRGGPPGR